MKPAPPVTRNLSVNQRSLLESIGLKITYKINRIKVICTIQSIINTPRKGEALAKSEIRVQYSGFILFAATMLSIVTGLAFTLMLTRSTTESQLGIWSNVNDIIAYFCFLASAIPFWAMRFAARDEEGSVKTGLVANLTISIIFTGVYLPTIPIIMSFLHISGTYIIIYLIASAQIIETHLILMLEAYLRARKPQTIGYGLLAEDSSKILIAYVLIIRLQQPLLGALLSVTIAFALHIIYYFKLVYVELRQPIRWSYVKEWLKGSTINIYSLIGSVIASLVFIMLIAYDPSAGPQARGIYLAAWTIASIIPYSSYVSFALYPKLLRENNVQDIITSLKRVLMFAIPMTVGAMVLSDSYLIMLNDIYKPAAIVLIILAVNALVQTLSAFFSPVLYGLEKIDEKAKIPLKELVKRPIFKAFSLVYVQSAIELPTAFYLLTHFAKGQPMLAAIYVSIVDTVAHLVMFLALYVILWKIVKINIPWMNITKYIAASLGMALFLFLIPHPTKLTSVFSITIVAGIIYFALLSAIDKDARILIRSIWQEIKLRF
jgi:O-antigen/teichoic acid export membrane protein